MMTKRYLSIVFCLAVIANHFVFPKAVSACICYSEEMPLEERIHRQSAIFRGTVISTPSRSTYASRASLLLPNRISNKLFDRMYHVEINKSWRGPRQTIVEVKRAPCPVIDLELGKEYLFVALDTDDGWFYAEPCAKTQLSSSATALADMAQLDQMYVPQRLIEPVSDIDKLILLIAMVLFAVSWKWLRRGEVAA